MNKEERVEQLASVFAKAIKGLENNTVDDCVLVPFSLDDYVEVTTISQGVKRTTVVNSPQ